MILNRISVYCGSSVGDDESYAAAARDLAQVLCERGIGVVYGGGAVGIMGVLADAMLERGGEVIGVIPKALAIKEVAHEGLSEMHVVASMHERKALMAELANGFIAMPGGWGTLEEIFEMLTWAQLGFHEKPCGLLNVGGYFDGLIDFLENAFAHKFVKELYRPLLMSSHEPQLLLEQFAVYQAPRVRKWMGEGEL
ncbi:MAG: TIGR00730 family Rossman fold protein [Lysobacterales bacterium]